MNLGSNIILLVGVFVALLIVVWVLMATSKRVPPRDRKGEESAVGDIPVSAQADATKASAEEQAKNTTTATAAWWWLNHNRDANEKPPSEDKSS